MNRVEDYYETAKLFYALPEMARYVIGTHFGFVKHDNLRLNPDDMSVKIFKMAVEKNKYTEFRMLVRNHKNHGFTK